VAVDVERLPRVFNRPSRLRCRGGWSEKATSEFLSGEFESLELECDADQSIEIPPLGSAAELLEMAELRVAGRQVGLEQIESLRTIDLPLGLPANGLPLSSFPRLRSLTINCDNQTHDLLAGRESLEGLGLVGWRDEDARLLSQFRELRELTLTQGRIRTLQGLEALENLQTLNLAYLRGFADLSSVCCLRNLASLDIENAPRLAGTLSIAAFSSLKSLRVVSTPISVDLGGLKQHGQLQKLWLNGECNNLSWPDLLALPEIRIVAIPVGESGAALVDDIERLVASHGRSIRKLDMIGPRRAQVCQLVLEQRSAYPA
jgi:hypothetical protein